MGYARTKTLCALPSTASVIPIVIVRYIPSCAAANVGQVLTQLDGVKLMRLCLQVCGLKAGEFVHFLGDAHVYSNHVGALEEQLQNAPRAFPTLHINPAVTDIDKFKFEDFEIWGYHPHKKIPMKMAV